MTSEKGKMLAGEPYDPMDPQLRADRRAARQLTRLFNETRPTADERRRTLLEALLGSGGETAFIRCLHKTRTMETAQPYEITGLGLSGTEYTVEQTGKDKNFRPEYEAEDVTGDTIFRCTHQMYEGNDTFPFVDANGNELLTVEASSAVDIAGDYVLTDSHTGEDIVILDNDFSLIQDTWRIHDAEDESLLATITSRGGLVTAGRKLLPVGQFIGHRYEIADAEGTAVGTIESGFAIQDQYEITIRDSSSVPVGPIVVGTVVIDAIQDT